MDVTFFENHAYYKSEIQGENANESHLWDNIPIMNTQYDSVHYENPSTSPVIDNPQILSLSPLLRVKNQKKKKLLSIREEINLVKVLSAKHI